MSQHSDRRGRRDAVRWTLEHPFRRSTAAFAATVCVITAVGCGSDSAAPVASDGPTTETTTPTTSRVAATFITEPPAPASTTTGTATTLAPASSSSTVAPTTNETTSTGLLSGFTVVIDPGHNGANAQHSREINRLVEAGGFTKPCNTTGTAAGSYAEAEFNWTVALRTVAELEARGATVHLTRETNDGWGPCVNDRAGTAARVDADLLVSIHADGSSAGNRGFHIIHPGRVAGYTDDIVGPSSAYATHLRDALVGQGFSPSNYIGSTGLNQRSDLGTLNLSSAPAVMLESGNMKDPTDIALLKSPDAQKRIAVAIATATELWAKSTPR